MVTFIRKKRRAGHENRDVWLSIWIIFREKAILILMLLMPVFNKFLTTPAESNPFTFKFKLLTGRINQ